MSLKDTDIKVKLRVFTGDNPACQFEGGQQRGGNFSCLCGVSVKDHSILIHCYRNRFLSLEERRRLIIKGDLWKKLETGETNPFQKLKKDELITELEHHEIWVDNEKKDDLMEKLSTKLHGICRPAALMCDDPRL